MKKEQPKPEELESAAEDLKQSPKDTGSAPVQIARFTAAIQKLGGHFQKHKKDFHSRRGLLKIISQRKRLLAYLKRTAPPLYEKTIARLGLRK